MGDRTKRPMTDEERNLIITLRIQGKSYPELSKLTGRPMGTISSVLSLAILQGECPRIMSRDPKVQRKTL